MKTFVTGITLNTIQLSIRDDSHDMSVSAFISTDEAQMLVDNLKSVLYECDAKRDALTEEAHKYMEEQS